MKRMLVVVDGSVQANLALDQALEIAQALPSSEVLLLNITPAPSPWQTLRPVPRALREISERVMTLALQRAKSAGVKAEARVEPGETAEVTTRIAHEERCDHIFLPEQESTPVARALLTLAGLSAHTAASRVISLSDVPVTVIARERVRERA